MVFSIFLFFIIGCWGCSASGPPKGASILPKDLDLFLVRTLSMVEQGSCHTAVVSLRNLDTRAAKRDVEGLFQVKDSGQYIAALDARLLAIFESIDQKQCPALDAVFDTKVSEISYVWHYTQGMDLWLEKMLSLAPLPCVQAESAWRDMDPALTQAAMENFQYLSQKGIPIEIATRWGKDLEDMHLLMSSQCPSLLETVHTVLQPLGLE